MRSQSKLSLYNKMYYRKNKKKIIERLRRKIQCDECGEFISQCYMKNHTGSKNCRKFKESNKSFEDKVNETLEFINDEFRLTTSI